MDEQLQQELTDLRNAALLNMALYDAAMADAQKLKDRIEELERDKVRLESEAMYGAASYREALEEIQHLKSQLNTERGLHMAECNKAVRLHNELESCRKDAQRYRWIANGSSSAYVLDQMASCEIVGHEIDQAIDAAMQEEAKP
ncbi:hypothetical protein [Metapseudomonas otitidis]|uniref:hypothetical protein n=1 Tax=Metapseudomonas otitidis TaxID=319939 RepID=UPI0024497448|nr:hypothetical protein [Pseudomonas otitidis]MDH0335124.1 hypothetical protein [Pseudomonas otitidis]